MKNLLLPKGLFYPFPGVEFIFCKRPEVCPEYHRGMLEKPYNYCYVYIYWLRFGYRFGFKIKAK